MNRHLPTSKTRFVRRNNEYRRSLTRWPQYRASSSMSPTSAMRSVDSKKSGPRYRQPSEQRPSTKSLIQFSMTATVKSCPSPTTRSESEHSAKNSKVKREPLHADRHAQTGIQVRQANRQDDRRSRNAARATHARPIASHHQDDGPRHSPRSLD